MFRVVTGRGVRFQDPVSPKSKAEKGEMIWDGPEPLLSADTEKKAGHTGLRFNRAFGSYQNRGLRLVWCCLYETWFLIYVDAQEHIQGAIPVNENLESWIEPAKCKINFRSSEVEDPSRIYEFRFRSGKAQDMHRWHKTVDRAKTRNVAEPPVSKRASTQGCIDLMSFCNDHRDVTRRSSLIPSASFTEANDISRSASRMSAIQEEETMERSYAAHSFNHTELQRQAPGIVDVDEDEDDEMSRIISRTNTFEGRNKKKSSNRRETQLISRVATLDSKATGPRPTLASRRATSVQRSMTKRAKEVVDLNELMENADTTGCLQNHSLALAALTLEWMGDEDCAGVEDLLRTCRLPLNSVIANTFTISECYNFLCLYINNSASDISASVTHLDPNSMDQRQFTVELSQRILMCNSTNSPNSTILLQVDLNAIYKIKDAPVSESIGLALERGMDETGGWIQIAFLSLGKCARDNHWVVLQVADEVLYEACSVWSPKARRVMGFVTLQKPCAVASPRHSIRSQYNVFQADTFAQTQFNNPRFEEIRFAMFQQPLNTCNISTLGFGLSMIGYPTTIDDIFVTTELPLVSIVDVGLTLKELYEVAEEYISNKDLPLTVEVWQPPEAPGGGLKQGAEEEFKKMLLEIGPNDAMLCNFNAKIAHGREGLEGGHFALLAAYNREHDQMVIADVNPKKYNQYWVTPVRQMLEAMVDHDSGAGEPRGCIVLRSVSPALQRDIERVRQQAGR